MLRRLALLLLYKSSRRLTERLLSKRNIDELVFFDSALAIAVLLACISLS